MHKSINQLRWLWLSVAVIFVDQLSKYLITKHLVLYEPMPLLPFLNLTLQHNLGAAFGFLNKAGGWQRWLLTIIAIIVSGAILTMLKRLPRNDQWSACGLALVLGGALGNLYDRITQAYVTDFIDFHTQTWHFAVFNLADTAINVGVAVWLIGMYLNSRKIKK